MTGPSGRDVRLAIEAATMDFRGFVQLTRQIWCCLWRRSSTGVTKETTTSSGSSGASSQVWIQPSAAAAGACDVCQQRVQPPATDQSALRTLDISDTSAMIASRSRLTSSSAPVSPQDPSTSQPSRVLLRGRCDIPGAGDSKLSAPQTPPVRLKASGKGLLERRGSNASLTLDLGSLSSDSPPVGSPPTECSAGEFLLSASHRMARRQLIDLLHNPLAIHEEFLKIPMNHPDKIKVPGSGMKNRYRTIIPNESTRVVLISSPDSNSTASYINANYIRGYSGHLDVYIATQGPMTNTVNDFWAMVWQEKSPAIVMITKLSEQNRTKCECYLPERCAVYGDVKVSVDWQSDDRFGCVRRRITLQHPREPGDGGDAVHELVHYWYSAWPDQQAPQATDQLLQLVMEVDRERQRPIGVSGRRSRPVVVHCSAGIGRTGCFIAISIAIQQLMHEQAVDILSIVCNLRLDRGGMVQTSEQYEFVHYAVSAFHRQCRHVTLSRLDATSPPNPTPCSSSLANAHDDIADLKLTLH